MYKVTVIGSGGAGLAAAIEASSNMAPKGIVVITKSKLGYSNTALAQGGIAASFGINDSSNLHYKDTMRCGDFKSDTSLVKVMTDESKDIIRWLEDLGVVFDKSEAGDYMLKNCLGSSVPRLLSCGDKTGAIIIGALTRKVKTLGIEIKEFCEISEIKRSKGFFEIIVGGDENTAIEAKQVILAAGGSSYGVAKEKGILTSNCKDATGMVLKNAVSLGAKQINKGSFQFHPLGYVLSGDVRGRTVPESVLALGAVLEGRNGKIDITNLKNRGLLASILLEADRDNQAFATDNGRAFKLYLRKAVEKVGKGIFERMYPKMVNILNSEKIDILNEPVLVFPTLHYQNGGIEIDMDGKTCVKGLYAAGEIAGGVHGTGRLMGNSLLDILCFGRRAGRAASKTRR